MKKGVRTTKVILGVIMFFCLTLALSSGPALASTFWADYGETGSSGASVVRQTGDGGYVVTGGTSFSVSDLADIWILKLDGNGGIQWQKTYGGPGNDSANSIEQTGDGGYIAAGYTNSFGAGDYDIWVLKVDGNGDVLWQNTYGGTGYDFASSVRETDDGGYVVVGGTDSFGAGEMDVWVLKLDGNGDVLWEKTYGGAGIDSASSIEQTGDGGYIVAGGTRSFGAGDYDFWVLKLDPNGSVLWQKTYGGTDYDFASSIRQTSDGGYIVAGGTRSFGAGDYDFLLLKLDPNGSVLWQKTYGGTDYDFASSIRQTSDGGYIVGGGTRSFGAGDYDFLVMKLDATGSILWQNTYGGTGYDVASSVEEIINDGYVVAGESNSFGNGNYNFFLVKLDWNGDIGKICSNVYHSASVKSGNPSVGVSQTSVTTVDSKADISAPSVTPQTTSAMTDSCLSGTIALTLSLPNGGESWMAGTSQTIKWSYTGNPGSTVKVELVEAGGSPSTIIDSTPIGTAGSGSYMWAIPAGQTPGTDYRVKITSGTYTGTSKADFTVASVPTITVTSPNGGESWLAGSTQTVTWTYTGNAGTTVQIDLVKGGASPSTIVKSTSMGSSGKGSYSWKIPGMLAPGTDYRVKVTSTSNSAYTDQSNADFTIDSTLTLTSPNGGESWTAGTSQTIKWSYTGSPGSTVKVELVEAGGSPSTIIDSTPIGTAGSGSYTWAIPASLTPAGDYRVRITSGTYVDASNADFTVAPVPTITVTSPNGGESWLAGSTQTVTWTYTGNAGTTVQIDLVKGGASPSTIVKSTSMGSSGKGSYSWKIPGMLAPGTDYRVKVTSTSNSAYTDQSNADFTIDSTLTLTSPNGGESWTAGTSQTIKWSYTGSPGSTVKVELVEAGGSPSTIIDSTPIGTAGSGSYTWAIPASLTPAGDYRVRITSGTYVDASNADFTVAPVPTIRVTSPNGGETWAAGTTQTVTWTYTGNAGTTVQIDLVKGGASPSTIVKSTSMGSSGKGSYSWKIPGMLAPGTDYRVKVTSTSNSAYTDQSNADFTIDSTLTLTSPNGGESWTAGTSQTIKWSYTGSPGSTVKVELVEAGGSPSTIIDSTPIGTAGSGSYTWAIPASLTPAGDYRVRITSGTYVDASNADFTVAPVPTITVTSPNGGESWLAGSTQTVTWTYTGNAGTTVQIDLVKGGASPSTIVKSTSMGSSGKGSYSWKIPGMLAPGTDYRVKVTSTSNSAYTDQSNADFTIDSTLTLTSPNGGESWTAGTSQTIKWSYTGSPGSTVKVELVEAGGSPSTIIDSTPIGTAGSGSYTWAIPASLTPAGDYRVRITSGTYVDASNADFTVAPVPTITVTSPNGGESWLAGSTQTVTWTYTGNAGTTVQIDLVKGGASPSTIVKSTSMGSSGKGSYSWKIPGMLAPGTDYRVKVTSTSNSAYTDQSNADFTIDSTLTLTSPNGGESWTAGTSQTIKWSYTGSPGSTVKVELVEAGGSPSTIIDSTPIGTAGSGSYTWAIPASLTPAGDYRVRITSGTYVDASNADFTVAPVPTIRVTSPNGGETWAAGTTQTVTWTYTGNAGTTVQIDLVKGGASPSTIVKSTSMGSSGKGSYSWKIPGMLAPGTDYRVKVTSTSNSAYTDQSNADFTIDSTLTLTSPNGGESWTAGTSQTIKWSYTGSPGSTVKVELVEAGGSPSTIIDSTPIGTAGSGSYTWAIPASLTPAGDYRVRITSGTYVDASNADFTVAPVPTITVTSPNGGETWAAGTTQTVTWTYTGNAGTTVQIDLVKGGASPSTIVKSTSMGSSGKGSYSWKIPGMLAPGTDYRVKVTSTSNSAYTDQSNADFTIDSTLTLTSPNGGESWTAGTSQTIKWSYTGSPGSTVKVELVEAGGSPSTIIDSTPIGTAGSGSYTWAIPASLTPAGDYRVRITSGTYVDASNADFTVAPVPTITVTSPNGGETWAAGTTQTVTWTYTGNAGTTVQIDLVKGGASPSTIVKSTSMGSSGKGSYSWKIPGMLAPGTDYRVRVTSTSNGSYTDTSEADFTINWMH